MSSRRPESEARIIISVMLVITFMLSVFLIATTLLDTTTKSIVLIAWMGIMMIVLRRYRL
ncbi:MAG: hypothetical protein JXJ20_07330 [Anaerolineae bacterium]|nr:hypothetical protein [Anaerolineae bacterium]